LPAVLLGFDAGACPHVCTRLADDGGRYTYRNQPAMCRWNCERLGVAWSTAMPGVDCEDALKSVYDVEYNRAYLEGARAKVSRVRSRPSTWQLHVATGALQPEECL
jgi:uncharacterized protein YdiU (UPF0061 family)